MSAGGHHAHRSDRALAKDGGQAHLQAPHE